MAKSTPGTDINFHAVERAFTKAAPQQSFRRWRLAENPAELASAIANAVSPARLRNVLADGHTLTEKERFNLAKLIIAEPEEFDGKPLAFVRDYARAVLAGTARID